MQSFKKKKNVSRCHSLPTTQRSAMPDEKKERVAALDWLKGALVVFMVIYHSLNYSGDYTAAAFRLMAFLPPSFILITGLLLTNSYLSRYKSDRSPTASAVANSRRQARLAICRVECGPGAASKRWKRTGLYSLSGSLQRRWREIFFAPSGRVASSSILVCIGYVLAPRFAPLAALPGKADGCCPGWQQSSLQRAAFSNGIGL